MSEREREGDDDERIEWVSKIPRHTKCVHIIQWTTANYNDIAMEKIFKYRFLIDN